MRSKSPGMSLLEIVSAASILLLIMSIVVAVIRSGQRTQSETQSVVALTGDVLAGTRQLRKDLEMTNLGSLRVFEKPPSCSMAKVNLSKPTTDFGTPAWNGHTYYMLEPGKTKATKLVRWTSDESKPLGLPKVSVTNPWDIPPGAKKSVAIKNLLSTAWSLEDHKSGIRLLEKPGEGGFRVRFIRQDRRGRALSLDNPSAFTDSERMGWSAGNTPLVQVDLVVVRADRSRLNAVKYDIRVSPRN